MDQFSIYSHQPSYEHELELLAAIPISERNKELIRAFHQSLLAQGLSDNRIVNLSRQLRRLASKIGNGKFF